MPLHFQCGAWDMIDLVAACPHLASMTAPPPFHFVAPIAESCGIVVASPHSGRHYPPALLVAAQLDRFDLSKSEDAWVDELVAGSPEAGACLLLANYARVYVDLNRDPDELDTSMYAGRLEGPMPKRSPRVAAGLGVIPRIVNDGRDIYRGRLAWAEADRRISSVYAPYHAKLRSLIDQTLMVFGASLLIDTHSMPAKGSGDPAPDIVLGDRYGSSCASLITAIAEQFLSRCGYRVVRNVPYAGGWTTEHYGKPFDGSHALQIEINRSLYMNETTMERFEDGIARLQHDLAGLTRELALALPKLRHFVPIAAQ
jgi:N-formylglutamate amidohydrolase